MIPDHDTEAGEIDVKIADVQCARTGDHHAFERLMHSHYRTVYAVALSYLHCRDRAEELAQEVFLRAWLGIGSLKAPELFSAWLLRMTRNLAVDWLRKDRRISATVQMVPLENEALEMPAANIASPSTRLSTEQDRALVQQALFKLPAQEREVVLLHYAESLSKSDIARQLNLHPSSVGRRLGSALFALRVQLDGTLRQALQPIRSRKPARMRSAALIAAVAAMPEISRAAVESSAALTLPSAMAGLIHPLHALFSSAAVRVRTFLAGAKQMITPFRLLTLGTAALTMATLFYLKPREAQAQQDPTSSSVGAEAAPGASQSGAVSQAASAASTKTESRDVSPFSSVNLNGSLHVSIQVGPAQSVKVVAQEEFLPKVETVVHDGALEIRQTDWHTGAPVEVLIDIPELKSTSISGSGKIEVRDLLAKQFTANISGSGELTAKGSTDAIAAHVSGSGKIHFNDVVAKTASANVAGSGKVEVNVSDSIMANVAGSGSVLYSGSASDVKKQVSGSGRVEHQ